MVYDYMADKLITSSMLSVAQSELARLKETDEYSEAYGEHLYNTTNKRIEQLRRMSGDLDRELTILLGHLDLLTFGFSNKKEDAYIVAIIEKIEHLRNGSVHNQIVTRCNRILMSTYKELSLRKVQ